MRRTILLSLLLGLLVTSTGCETIKGLGRDITNAGEAIERATR
ncbi:MAG: entericidin A/B family lipoprotein [Gammaproteobacteria bacterium]|nr:entericidin A/B family lipoprotein [Gammaproteobacteria bacterium]